MRPWANRQAPSGLQHRRVAQCNLVTGPNPNQPESNVHSLGDEQQLEQPAWYNKLEELSERLAIYPECSKGTQRTTERDPVLQQSSPLRPAERAAATAGQRRAAAWEGLCRAGRIEDRR